MSATNFWDSIIALLSFARFDSESGKQQIICAIQIVYVIASRFFLSGYDADTEKGARSVILLTCLETDRRVFQANTLC